jgi:hypothetical protein
MALIRADTFGTSPYRRWRDHQEFLRLLEAEWNAEQEREALRLQREREPEPEPAPEPEPERPALSQGERSGRRTTHLTYEAMQRAREELRFRRGQV